MNRTASEHSTTVIILAAGLSNRFTGDKMVAKISGKPMIRYTVESALASSADHVIVVLNDRQDSVAHLLPREVRIVINSHTTNGLSSSISLGVREVKEKACSCVLLLGDQPMVSSAMLDRLIELHLSNSEAMIAYRYKGETRNPALFPRSMFERLCSLKGDQGARSLVTQFENSTIFIDVEDDLDLTDIDTDDDLSWAEDHLSATRKQ